MSDGDGKVPAISVAPMIDVTDRNFRMFIRCISDVPVLWTEMTWDRAILYNAPEEPEYELNKNRLPNGERQSLESIIGFSDQEHPIVMQLGGSDPEMLRRSAVHAVKRGYDEINLNCGCPAQTRGRSRNCFGARLMFEPERVAACCEAIRDATRGTNVAVTVKCRLGVNERDSYEELREFVDTVSAAGITHFIVHARKAILNLDTAKNRSVPPLRHDWVLRLIADYPHLRFTINGGVTSWEQVRWKRHAGGGEGGAELHALAFDAQTPRHPPSPFGPGRTPSRRPPPPSPPPPPDLRSSRAGARADPGGRARRDARPPGQRRALPLRALGAATRTAGGAQPPRGD